MIINYTILHYGETEVNIDGIIDDLKRHNILEDDMVINDIYDNYYYYLDRYSTMPMDGEPDEESLDDLVNVIIDKLHELQNKV
ncbi:hypothetical protein [Intestinibacter sp.]|uniref:hypothetical protein n=1 Tax=Intestinibacter sp. TaxID=1965304 RepID=UPI003F153EDE